MIVDLASAAMPQVVINASDSADMKFKDQLENEIQIVKESREGLF